MCLLFLFVYITFAETSKITFSPPWLWTEEQFPGEDNIEDYVFDLVNKERQKHKLPSYKKETPLVIAARQHSKEMIEMNYFSHDSPRDEWKEPYQRAYYAGFLEAYVGENIAYNFGENDKAVAANLMKTWLKSPGHRANILNKEYTHLGVGVVKTRKNYEGYDYDYYYATQVFAQKYYDYSGISMRDDGNAYVLSGSVTPRFDVKSVRVLLDDDDMEGKSVKAGEPFAFTVKIKKNSGRHKIGLFPDNFVKYQFFIDADKDDGGIFIPRFYEY